MEIEQIAQNYDELEKNRNEGIQEITNEGNNLKFKLSELEKTENIVNEQFKRQISKINIPSDKLDLLVVDYLNKAGFSKIERLGWKYDVFGEVGKLFRINLGLRKKLSKKPIYFRDNKKDSILFQINPNFKDRYHLLTISKKEKNFALAQKYLKNGLGFFSHFGSSFGGLIIGTTLGIKYTLSSGIKNENIFIPLILGGAFLGTFTASSPIAYMDNKLRKAYQNIKTLATGKYKPIAKLVDLISK